MNIFVTDPDPWKSAQVLPDKHIVKMPLETCQMLSIVCSEMGHGFGTILGQMGNLAPRVPSGITLYQVGK